MQAVHTISTKHNLISTYRKYRGIHILLFVLPFHHLAFSNFGKNGCKKIYRFNSYMQEFFISRKFRSNAWGILLILYMIETSTRSRGGVIENSKEMRLCCVCIDFYHRGANIAKIWSQPLYFIFMWVRSHPLLTTPTRAKSIAFMLNAFMLVAFYVFKICQEID
jgi:hypothetical protein